MASCRYRDEFAFAPIFDPRSGSRHMQEKIYLKHRQGILNATKKVDTSPPHCMMKSYSTNIHLTNDASRYADIQLQNESFMARIAKAMIEPSKVDCHNNYKRIRRNVEDKYRRDRLRTTYDNFQFLNMLNSAATSYPRMKFLREWEKAKNNASLMAFYSHDWVKPEFSTAILQKGFRFKRRPPEEPLFPDVEIVSHRLSKNTDLDSDLRMKAKAMFSSKAKQLIAPDEVFRGKRGER